MKLLVDPSKKWTGPQRKYDIVKEGVIALIVIALISGILSLLFSSPDEPALTLKSWAREAPADFALVATTELAGTSGSATYGPPYNSNGTGQHWGPIKLQDWAGIRIPIDSANDFVIKPVSQSTNQSALNAVATWKSATTKTQLEWANAYADALDKSKKQEVVDGSNSFGPVPNIINALLAMAQSGELDGALAASDSNLPTNFTKPLLFLADSDGYFGEKASAQHLQGDQWGVMNETGSWPGQTWLWLFSFWYQIEPFKSSDNADTIIMTIMAFLTLGLALFPILPIIRRIPYVIPIHRIIWRKWYRNKL